jgi:MFS family permease
LPTWVLNSVADLVSSATFHSAMTSRFVNLRAGLRQLEFRLMGELSPSVRHNRNADFYAAAFFGVFVSILPFIPVVLRRLGASAEWIAFYNAQPFLGYLFVPLSAMLMPRQRGLKWYATVFWLLSRGSFLLVAFITRWEMLIGLTLVFWICETFPLPVYTRMMQAIFPAGVRGRVMAFVRVGLSLVNLAMTPLAGWLLDAAGYRVLFPIGSVCAVLATFLFLRLRFNDEDVPPNPASSAASLWRLLGEDGRFAVYLGGLTLFGFGFLSGTALQALVQVDRLQLSYGEIGALGVVHSVFFLLGYLVLGRLLDRFGGAHTLRWVFVIGAAVPLSYLFATSGWMLAPAFAAMGLVNAGMDLGAINTVMQLSPPERLGDYSALQTTALGLRGLIAPFLGVWLVSAGWSYEVTFGVGAVLVLFGAAMLWAVRPVTRSG